MEEHKNDSIIVTIYVTNISGQKSLGKKVFLYKEIKASLEMIVKKNKLMSHFEFLKRIPYYTYNATTFRVENLQET